MEYTSRKAFSECESVLKAEIAGQMHFDGLSTKNAWIWNFRDSNQTVC